MTNSNPAVSQLEKVVTRSPGSPAFARLADIYRSQGQVDKAISLCENGVKANPIYPTGHLLLGRCYFEMERVDEALAEFETVLKLDWKNLFALKIMGDIQAQKGQRERAARFYKRASDIDPFNVAVRDMFRRFEKYYSEESAITTDPTVISESPAETIARTIEERPAPSPPPVDFMDESLPVNEPQTENVEIPEVLNAVDEVGVDDLELPSQPESDLHEIADETEHAPINRNIDDFNDAEPTVTSSDTEMVDLPPEMTGQREERVGDFNARKSVLNRIMDEQSALLETLPQAPDTAPELPEMEEETETTPQAAAAAPEISTSAPGMDGYYSVDGGDSGDAGTAMLDGLENIELDGAISEEDHAEEHIEEVRIEEVQAEENDPLKDLMLDIDADDSVKEFLAATEVKSEPKLEPEPEPKPEPKPEPESGISSSAAGMGGYYNVSGTDAVEDGIDILQDIDTVELSDTLTETEVDNSPTVELGLDIELPEIPELTITEPHVMSKEEEEIKASEMDPGASSGETVSQSDIDGIFSAESEQKKGKVLKRAGKKKPEKVKKQNVKVVSNVATMSLADIYLRQGHKEQALTVFKKLLKQDPANQDLKDRIQTLKEELEKDQEIQQ